MAEAKQRRERHFRSTLGPMLNENHCQGFVPQNSVQQEDFIHIPTHSFPTSTKALEFLEKKFAEKPERNRSSSTTSGLLQAYRNVTEQPVGMVHYDREPFFWPGRADNKPSAGCETPVVRNNDDVIMRSLDYIINGGGRDNYNNNDNNNNGLFTPDNDNNITTTRESLANTPTTTIDSKRTGRSSSVLSSCREKKKNDKPPQSPFVKVGLDSERAKNKNTTSGRFSASGKSQQQQQQGVRFMLGSPDYKMIDKTGFKPYSPFSDTSFDFDAKEARRQQNLVVPGEPKDVLGPLAAPKYSDALNRVLDISSADAKEIAKYKNQRPADFLKLHGNPEYPSKVMDDKDIPNYVAWAKIYPYCPLTQKEGEEKPVFVPPRGFTPSTPSRPPTQAKLRDIKKTKRNIMEGIKLLSSSSSSRKRQQLQLLKQGAHQSVQRNANVVVSQDQLGGGGVGGMNYDAAENKKNVLLGINININNNNDNNHHRQALELEEVDTARSRGSDDANNTTTNNPFKHITVNAIENLNKIANSPLEKSPTTQAYNAIMHDPTMSRKILDLKMARGGRGGGGGDAFYTGKTPTRTPSPESRPPLPANRAWVKHYSPAQVQRFLAGVNKARPVA